MNESPQNQLNIAPSSGGVTEAAIEAMPQDLQNKDLQNGQDGSATIAAPETLVVSSEVLSSEVKSSEVGKSEVDRSEVSRSEADSEDWTTVTFPNALSVEMLPEQMEETPVQPSLVSGDFYLKVQSQNEELRSQVAELEAALVRSQASLRAEMERWEALALAQSDSSESSESLLAQQNQALSGSQDRLSQLFSELESSHRMAQRQQILVETLTEQLQNSHEQIAQLERECVAVQQRASEMQQQLSQSEQTNRDLRSRLHRQQRYTLQFKAALEKCLDVPPATAQGFVADFLEEPAEKTPKTPKTPIVATPPKVKIPRSQPVQPWSVTTAVEASGATELQSWVNAIVDHADNTPDDQAKNQTVEVDGTSQSVEPIERPIENPIQLESSDSTAPSGISLSAMSLSEGNVDSQDASAVTEVDEANALNLNAVERNPHLDETERRENWAEVIAQVNAIMGESVTIVEQGQPTDPATTQPVEPRPPIAPVIAKTKSQKRESMAAIDLPSFPKVDR